MLALFTVKKILFFTGLGSVIVGPIVATSPIIKEFGLSSSSASPLKLNMASTGNVELYEEENLTSFLKNALLHREAQQGLIESFAQELSFNWYFSQPKRWTAQSKKLWTSEGDRHYAEAWKKLQPKDAQKDFWDNYWGSKESMYAFWLKLNSYQFVREFLTTFDKSDLTLNKEEQGENLSSKFIRQGKTPIEDEITKSENWNKIALYPQYTEGQNSDAERILWGKYEFLNWSFNKWFIKTLPLYFKKLSWEYKIDASKEDLEREYNFTVLGDAKPARASYAFPIFRTDSIKGFKAFIEGLKSAGAETQAGSGTGTQTLKLENSFIESWKGDREHTSTLVQLFNSLDSDSPEAVAAASYLLGKLIEKDPISASDNQSGNSYKEEKINPISSSKLSQANSSLNPISIFFGERKSNQGISFESSIFNLRGSIGKNSGNDQIFDVREWEASDWLFFRDQRGVHAISLDGFNHLKNGTQSSSGQAQSVSSSPKNQQESGKLADKLFSWFKFRSLHTLLAEKMDFKKDTVLRPKEDWYDTFSAFLSSNFENLFTEFYLEKGEDGYLFKTKLNNKEYFKSFQELLKSLFELRAEENLNSKIFQLRRLIIERYGLREWEVERPLLRAQYLKVAKKEGLSAPFPYRINVDSTPQTGLFPQQEAIFSELLSKKREKSATAVRSEPATGESKKLNAFTEKLKNYKEALVQLIEKNEKVKIEVRSNGFSFINSQRVFIKDPIFDYLLDKILSKRELLNYLLKEKKILNTQFLDNNRLLRILQGGSWVNLPWEKVINPEKEIKNLSDFNPAQAAPSNVQGDSSGNTDFSWKATDLDGTGQQNKKKLYQLLNSLLKLYFFREQLKKANQNYFNFQADFPNLREESRESVTSSEGSKDFDIFRSGGLFELWVSSSYFNTSSKTIFLDFLIGLHYLSRDKFAGLRERMTKQLQDNNKYHYLSLEKLTYSSSNSSARSKLKIHPFLPSERIESTSWSLTNILGDAIERYFKDNGEAKAYIREGWRAKGSLNTKPKSTQTLMFHSLKAEQSTLPSEKNNLFNYKDIATLITTINSISSLSEFKKLVSKLSSLVPSISTSLYDSEKIYIENSKEQDFNLENKKKALIYQVMNTNKNLYLSVNLKEDEQKQIFDSSFEDSLKKAKEYLEKRIKVETTDKIDAPAGGGTTTGETITPIKDALFERASDDSGKNPFLQLSMSDFEDTTSIAFFFSLLPDDLLAELLMRQIDRAELKEKAQNHFFENTPKWRIHDLKFKNHIDKRHLD